MSKRVFPQTRRTFVVGAVSAGIAAAVTPYVWATAKGPRIKSAVRREDTVVRHGGVGDNWHMSWASDDRQYVGVCDGLGFQKQPKGYFNSHLYAIAGGPHEAVFEDVAGYPELFGIPSTEYSMRYYGFGILALDRYIYQFLSTPNHQFVRPDSSPWPDARFVGAKLIYSPDQGHTWCNQDGSTPVRWEPWQDRSARNMVFFEEPQGAFSLLSVLQMGRSYSANQDGYVYVYSPNGHTDGTMNQLVMFRVPKSHLLDRSAYEYFAGWHSNGGAAWVKDINARSMVHAFPKGWVNIKLHPWAWMPSVTYNTPLGLYMMTSWGTGCAPDGSWFGKPSYFGLWISRKPWGPWTQIHEETVWLPHDDAAARAFAPQISPKWIAPDGKSFWLIWSDFQTKDNNEAYARLKEEFREKRAKNQMTAEDWTRNAEMMRKHMPYYAFNAQRVDLMVA